MKKKIDLVVSFDTTGSMYPVLAQVRQEVEFFVKEMFLEFSDLKIGIIAHGDYCDKDDPYTIMAMGLTKDKNKLCNFIKRVKQTYGGDADECYELVLDTAASIFEWREDAQKIMLMIGDASPHSKDYYLNNFNLDWKEESQRLAEMGVKVFAVHALSYFRNNSKVFYQSVADITGGTYLTLDQFNEVTDLIKATCYQQDDPERLNEFITYIKDYGRYTNSMERNINRLQGKEVVENDFLAKSKMIGSKTVELKSGGKMTPVLPGRFQVMTPIEDTPIKSFVESNGISFKKGRGFYELTKHVKVQQYKEIIAQNRTTGEMYTGSQVREMLGLKPQSVAGGVTENLSTRDLTGDYRIFIQSTSHNRKLIGGTTFLYEIKDMEDVGTKIESAFDHIVKESVKARGKVDTIKSPKAKSKTVKKEVSKTKEEIASTTIPVKSRDIKLSPTEIPESLERLQKQFEKVIDGAGRYETSTNKRNTTFFKNNLNKLISETEKILSVLDK